MIFSKRWQIALLTLLPLLLVFVYMGLGSDDLFLGALMCACLIAGCFCSLALNKPELGILSILIALAFTDRRLEYMSFSFHLIFLAVAICFVHYFVSHATTRKLFWFFAFLIGSYHILLLIVRPYPAPIFRIWTLNCLQQLAIFLWCILIKWDAKRIMNLIIPCLVYMLIFGFAEKLILSPVRIGGPTTYATNYAVLLTFLWIIWFVYSYLSEKNLLIIIFVSLLVILAVFLSGTKMGFLGLVIGFFGAMGAKLWIKNLDKPLYRKLLYIISVSFFIALLVFGIWQFLPKDLFLVKSFDFLLSGKLDNSSLGRVVCWLTAIKSFSEEPIWGIGPLQFIVANTEFLAQLSLIGDHKLQPLGHAHSIALNVLAENGLVGFIVLSIAFIACWIQLIKFLLREPKNPLGYALLFGGIIIFSMPMIDMIPSPGWDSWFYGILVSLGFHNKVVQLPNPKDKFNIKSISQHSEQ